MTDPMLELVAQLPRATVPPDRARRIQARCQAALRRPAPPRVADRPLRWPSWSAAVVGLGTLYLAEAVRHALQVYSAR